MSEPKAAATGNLAKTPIPELLVYALDHALDGTLVLEEPDGRKSAILFQAGAPAKAKTAEPVAYLGQVLVEQGSIDQATYERALREAQATRQLFGHVLLQHKLMSNEALVEGLREQVIQKVSHLFNLSGETVFGFYAGSDFLARWGGHPTRVKPLPLMWRGLRLFSDAAKVDALVARIGARQLKLYFEAPVGRFKLTPQERGVVDMLRARPTTLDVLLGSGLGNPSLVKRVVYALAVTRQLDFGIPGVEPLGLEEAPSSARLPVASASDRVRPKSQLFETRSIVPSARETSARPPGISQPPRVPAELSPELLALKQELEERAAAGGQTCYEILGVPEDATTHAIQAAFFQLAKVWHPDRLPPELSELRASSTKLFARMSEAHQILTDAERRREYDQLLRAGAANSEEQEQVAQIVRAAAAFQRAEVLLKKRDLKAAETEALAAMKGDPDQAEYKALYAWICAEQPREKYDELIQLLNSALKSEPNNQRALWYRGQLHKRAGDSSKALRDFKQLLELNPKHLDAQREVRLHEMRRSQPKEDKGILGKWFKR
jgi:curved DNA-binding protein CbpA